MDDPLDLTDLGFETRAIHGGTGPDADYRRRQHPDLSVLHLQTGRRRRGPRLRVRPNRQSHPGQPRSQPGRARGRRPSGLPSPAAWRPRMPSCACCDPGDHLVLPTDMLRRNLPLGDPGPWLRRAWRSTTADLRLSGRRDAAHHPHGVGRDADQPAASHHRHREPWPRSPTARAPSWSWTTPSPPRGSSNPSASAPTSWSIRPPSTSAGTPT